MDKMSHQSVIGSLSELGLSEHEAQVYLAVLRHDEVSAGVVIAELKLHREQIYRALRRLVEEGLLSEFQKKGKSVFRAIEPDVFVKRSQTSLSIAEGLLPYLNQMKQKSGQVIQVSEGDQALKFQLEDILSTLTDGGEYLVLGGVGDLFYDAAKKYLPVFENRFKQQKISGRILVYQGAHYPNSFPFGEQLSIKELPRPFGIPASTIIYGHKVGIDLLDPENIAIITIENEKVAGSYRKTFEALWSA
jgi:predicted transcriptional regulator